jgi:hypothetical protein
MPEKNTGADDTAPAVPVPVAEEPAAKQPETEAERRKRRLAEVEKESDDAKSKRRAAELAVHHSAHTENVAAAHERYPAPVAFERDREYTRAEIENWNARRKDIDMANKAYHRAVRRTVLEHQAEDEHCARVRATKQNAA